MKFKEKQTVTVFADWKIENFTTVFFNRFKEIFDECILSKHGDGKLFERQGFSIPVNNQQEENVTVALLEQMSLIIETQKPEFRTLVGFNHGKDLGQKYACIEIQRINE